jgi:DNA-binding XRE family transcriptional regulator/quercetin dioxygenase-like cupin family protein
VTTVRDEPGEHPVGDLLAANLKGARVARGISLSELARLSGISKATLSHLESGTGNPTVETVLSLSRALGRPLADLLERLPPHALTVVRGGDVAPVASGDATLRRYGTIGGGPRICEVYDQRIGAGGRRESTGHPGTEHTVVHCGTLHVEVDGRSVDVGPGDYVSFDASLPHVYTAGRERVHSVLLVDRDAPA